MSRTRAPVVAVAATGLMALAACDTGPPGAPPEPEAAAGAGLLVADAGPLGRVVTDQGGYTLYRFDRDRADPSAATCADDCARLWPPMLVRDARQVALAGVDRRLVGAVHRSDGRTQLTFNGWPLYHFADDVRPGETHGQGVGGTWFATTPDGNRAQTAIAAPPPDSGGR